VFSWRLNFLELPIKLTLENLTGQNVTFSKVDYRPFNRVTINDLTIGGDFRSSAVTVYINPAKLLSSLNNPSKALTTISVKKPWISKNFIALLAKSGGAGSSADLPSINIDWQDGEIDARFVSLKDFSGQVKLGSRTSGIIDGNLGGNKIHINLNLSETDGLTKADIFSEVKGPDSDLRLFLNSQISKDGSIRASLDMPHAIFSGFSFSGSSGTFNYHAGTFTVLLANRGGFVEAHGTGTEDFELTSNIELKNIIAGSGGTVSAKAKMGVSYSSCAITADNVNISGRAIGSGVIDLSRPKNGQWSGRGMLSPSDYLIEVSLTPKQDFDILVKTGKAKPGRIFGSLNPPNIAFDFSSWPIEKLPVVYPENRGLSGTIDFSGSMDAQSWDLKFAAKNLRRGSAPGKTAGTPLPGEAGAPLSINSALTMADGIISFHSFSDDGKLSIDAERAKTGEWRVLGTLDSFDAGNMLNILNNNLIGLSGIISGNFELKAKNISELLRPSSAVAGSARLKARDFKYGVISADEAKIRVILDSKKITIKDFALHSNKGTVSGQASLGLAPGRNECDVNLVFYRFPVEGKVISGPCSLAGTLYRNGSYEFNGNLTSSGLTVDAIPLKKLSARISASPKKITLSDFWIENIIRGSITAGLEDKSLAGKATFLNIDLSAFLPGAKGIIEGEAKISGTLAAPVVNITYSSPEIVYNGIKAGHKGSLLFKDKVLLMDYSKTTSGPAFAELRGEIFPVFSLSGKFDSITPDFFNSVSIPGLLTRGRLSGTFSLNRKNNILEASARALGKNIEIAGQLINEFDARIAFSSETLRIDSLTAKFSDSELNLLSGSFVTPSRKTFSLKAEFRNIHSGLADFFGGAAFEGRWDFNESGKLILRSSARADNLWINQYNLKEAFFGLKFEDNVLTLLPEDESAVNLSGHIDFSALPQVRFQRFRIYDNESSTLMMDGEIGKNRWDFMLSGKNVASGALTEIFSLPVPLGGLIDVNIAGAGTLDNPQIEGGVNISNGSLAEIPFDNLNLQLSVKQDSINIINARLVKTGSFSLSASGLAPFFLTPSARERVRNARIELDVLMEQGNLQFLPGLIKEVESASGTMQSQMHIGGNFSKPVANGFLRIIDATVYSKVYFHKLSNLNADIIWKDNLLSIREFRGRIGSGNIRIAGSVKFDGLAVERYNLSMFTEKGSGISIFIPELPIPSPLVKQDELGMLSTLSRGEPKCSVAFTGTGENPKLSGWVELENTHFTYPSLAKPGDGESILEPLWPKLNWDIEFRSGKNTWYENDMVSINTQGGIKLSGKGAFPTVNGKIESLRGVISYLGTEFKIKQAVVEIVKNDIILEAEAETEIFGKTSADTDYIRMYIDKAQIGRIKPRFVSQNNPSIASEKALSRATGIDAEIYSAADREYMLRQQLVRIFDSTLTTPLAKNLLRASGLVDAFRVQYRPQPIETAQPGNPTLLELLYGTRYSMEKYISDRIAFGYSVTFDQMQNKLDLRHEVELSYRWLHNIFFKGTYEIETKNPFRQYDKRIVVEQQWRFGGSKKNKTGSEK